MADIAAIRPVEALAEAEFVASTPAGDLITGVETSQPLIIEVDNGHASAVTVTIPPLDTTVDDREYGKVTKAGITAEIPAGETWIACIPATLIRLYTNAAGKIPVNYTSGNAALLVRFIQPK